MFNGDKRILAKLAPKLERVLIGDPHAASAYLLSDIMKSMGAKRCVVAQSENRTAEMLAELNPQLIFLEIHGPDFDGAGLITKLRRGRPPCRAAPVIVVSGDAREPTIRLAQNAGAHEFLAKPFTAASVAKRVENVLLKSRPWIELEVYVGPCRRRFNSGAATASRRRGDAASEAEGGPPASAEAATPQTAAIVAPAP